MKRILGLALLFTVFAIIRGVSDYHEDRWQTVGGAIRVAFWFWVKCWAVLAMIGLFAYSIMLMSGQV